MYLQLIKLNYWFKRKVLFVKMTCDDNDFVTKVF